MTGIAYKDCNWQVPYKVSPENKTRIFGFDGREGISQNPFSKNYMKAIILKIKFKGTVSGNLSDPPCQKREYPIYNGTLKSFV